MTSKSEARLAGGNSFDVRGNPIARQAAVYDIGVYSQLSPTLSAGINYRVQHGDNTRIHTANFNLTWLF
ncbi:autotransporter outer membrane beta-barrel domain-containing protein [Methylobacillus sp. Pita2]|uniref:autotransporter outer membrane beta-barrel domain-containing protein n=1 Tax=Methylobacillus sp. Pita2 TaxID=3383245 RepID=UPI0038B6106D